MASGTNYSQEYGQAEKAYLESNFAQAAKIIDHLADEFPNDPSVLLLRGHVYCYGFQNYALAKNQYESVLDICEEQDLLDFARSGIEQVEQFLKQSQMESESVEHEFDSPPILADEINQRSEITPSPLGGVISDSVEDSIGIDFPDEDAFEEGLPADDDNSQNYNANSLDNALDSEQIDSEYSGSFNDNQVGRDPFVSNQASNQEEHSRVHNSSTFMVDSDEEDGIPDYTEEDFSIPQSQYEPDYEDSSELEIDTVLTEPFSMENDEEYKIDEISDQDGLDYQDELEFDEIDSSFFDLEELEQGLPDTGLFDVAEEHSSVSSNLSADLMVESSPIEPEDIAVSSSNSNSTKSFTTVTKNEPQIEVKQGTWASFINAPIQKKQLLTAGITGLVSAIAVLIIGIVGSSLGSRNNPERSITSGVQSSLLLALVAGLSSAGTAAAIGNITAKHVTKASKDLQSQFDDVYQGNLNAKATVYSQDEFGQLASDFNRMTRVILTTTQEAQRRAEETEQAKEDLQRQVIRLLDDVEGAARGDLTVQATVTADVLGAVADAFNLTIQSLREIVRQVKEAAEQVNKGSTDSELFARNQSSEALRMAEELAVTLNSVQMMTESIERVADNAREAEEVARSSSVTALKGGKAVERTVSGIFQIRETVSETARKVKRLAEASQEISKIVLLISQIAERTNQLALNASIQAAKAGEAGRGFAVVADEVRQLADRSGKSLKEIEQIVLQIQSETGSVMTAMEEGIQEVIDVTERAEQAKTALEDIIQVSNRIDTLVRSITADTVEQRENSRAVAQVMQSVELTAQATSQESQRVGGALQSLVGIARGLLSSVERFRIDKGEE